MKIAVFATKFPIPSETFVVQQVQALLEHGADVVVFRDERGDDELLPAEPAGGASLRVVTLPGTRGAVIARLGAATSSGRLPAMGPLSQGLTRPLANGVGRLNALGVVATLADEGPFDGALAHFGPCGEKFVGVKEHYGLDLTIGTVFHGYDVSTRLRATEGPIYPVLRAASDPILPVSRFWARRLEELGFPSDRVAVHHMGVDLRDFALRTSFSASGPIRLLSVGRMVEKKGFEFGVRAVAHLVEGGADVVYRLVGDGPLRAGLEDLAGTLGVADRVEFLGWRTPSQVAAHLAEADVFLAPSVTASSGDMEGIPVALMEAMATGALVVSTRHSGIPELVEDRVTGWLADERDPHSLATAIAEATAARDRWPEIAAAAHARVEAEFNWKRLAADTVALFERESSS